VPDRYDHLEVVNHWMEQAANGLSSAQVLSLFEQAMGALCQRAYLTLGDVTLTAIVDRVLYNAAEKFPLFEVLEPGTRGINCDKLHNRSFNKDNTDLVEGIRFVLAEFLVVVGNLTADVLTPALHSELCKVAFNDPRSGGSESGEGN
jgi:hypothetical protein